jgi:hypothetical protein
MPNTNKRKMCIWLDWSLNLPDSDPLHHRLLQQYVHRCDSHELHKTAFTSCFSPGIGGKQMELVEHQQASISRITQWQRWHWPNTSALGKIFSKLSTVGRRQSCCRTGFVPSHPICGTKKQLCICGAGTSQGPSTPRKYLSCYQPTMHNNVQCACPSGWGVGQLAAGTQKLQGQKGMSEMKYCRLYRPVLLPPLPILAAQSD